MQRHATGACGLFTRKNVETSVCKLRKNMCFDGQRIDRLANLFVRVAINECISVQLLCSDLASINTFLHIYTPGWSSETS